MQLIINQPTFKLVNDIKGNWTMDHWDYLNLYNITTKLQDHYYCDIGFDIQ